MFFNLVPRVSPLPFPWSERGERKGRGETLGNEVACFFPWSFEPLRDVFPLFMSHVGLALKEHKLNFQQWSSTLLIFDGPVTYFSGLLVSL